ncbi:MAG TPA: tetratricopeptide repeat protein [Steroidobacteraceae bacterium]|nr:tetratricopeptide repeat protein [Steroidobacteraceae bacterium]
MTAVHRLGASLIVGAALASAIVRPAATPAAPTPAPPASTAPAAPAIVSTPEERLQVYREFRALFDAQKFSDAAVPAERLVAMTEAASGPNDGSLIAPLVNLATTRYQASDYAGAEQSYLRAIRIIEQKSGGLSKDLLTPIRGLGLTYLAAGQPEAALDQFRRGVDLVRKVDGLFSENQEELLDPLVRSYQLTGQMAEAEQEAIYRFRVSENKFGRNSAEVVPALEKLAQWYSDVGRNTTARQYFGRAAAIVQKTAGPADLKMIPPLRGIANTYRLEYIYGPELAPDQQQPNPGSANMSATLGTAPTVPEFNTTTAKPDSSGEGALRSALSIAAAARPNADPALESVLLLDLGDWQLLAGDKDAAIQSYRTAWPLLKDLPAPQNTLLAAPSQVFYRMPPAAYRSQHAKEENIIEGFVDVEFTVAPDGKTTGEHTVGKNATDAQEKSVLTAVKKARYRPRFEDGTPVATPGMRLHQPVYTVKNTSKN